MTRKPHDFRTVPEHRWPVVVAILGALTLYSLQPSPLVPWLRWVVLGICAVMLLSLVFLNPHRLNRETRWSRVISVVLSLILLAANQLALVALIVDLLHDGDSDAGGLLLLSLQVWATNVIAYAVVYWELDRGGPVVRRREPRSELPPAAFRFPQDEDDDAVVEVAAGSSAKSDWTPEYFDYLYFSASNSMAFSPTDTMPLTRWAKALMLLESFSGFVILALVIARAVSVIG